MMGDSASLATLSGMLEGFPLGVGIPMNDTTAIVFREYRLFAGIDMGGYKLVKASEKPVATGAEGVWANLYYGKGGALIYAANLTAEKRSATLSVDLATYGVRGRLAVETLRNDVPKSRRKTTEYAMWKQCNIDNGKVVKQKLAADAAAFKAGVPCELPPYSSVPFKIKSV